MCCLSAVELTDFPSRDGAFTEMVLRAGKAINYTLHTSELMNTSPS